MESKEERLLRAIFSAGDDPDDNYPETVSDKVGYAEHVVTHSLEYIGKALHRLSRLRHLLAVSEKGDGNTLPNIITNNELRMALEPLLHVERDINEIAEMLVDVYRATKPEGGEG